MNIVKPSYVVTSIKQSPVSKGRFFFQKILYELNLF